jgi:hypothetical protein
MQVEVHDAIACRTGRRDQPVGCRDRTEARVQIRQHGGGTPQPGGRLADGVEQVDAVDALHHEPPVTRVEHFRHRITLRPHVLHQPRLAGEVAGDTRDAEHTPLAVFEDLGVASFGDLRPDRLHRTILYDLRRMLRAGRPDSMTPWRWGCPGGR